MRIGVYGGSFNPCHLMHKKLVNKLLDNNYFDRIIIIPTGNYYRKSNLLKGEERIKLLEIMFKDNPRVIISDYEFKNNLICTYRSMDYLQNMYKGDELYFILGSDNLLSFHTWKRYEYLLDTYNLLVIKRKNVDVSKQLEQYSKYKGKLECIDLELDGISSSEVRDLLDSDNNDLAKQFLDVDVYNYIIEKGLYTKNYKEDNLNISDADFLKNYNSETYEKMSVTTDITLFSVSDIKTDNYRMLNEKAFSILLVKRTTPPFIDKWCLPGGFLSLDETLIDCAKRVLFVETNLDNIYLEQLYTFSEIERDIRTRVLSCSYLGLIDKNKIENRLKENAKFFNVKLNKKDNILTINFKCDDIEFNTSILEEVDSFGIVNYKEIDNNYLAFDNLNVIATSINRLKNKINYTDIIFNMMPKRFTLKELQLVYEAILGKKLLDPVFRRNISDKVIKTNEIKVCGGHRPSSLYEYKGALNNE